jgi:hypothetical protein
LSASKTSKEEPRQNEKGINKVGGDGIELENSHDSNTEDEITKQKNCFAYRINVSPKGSHHLEA